jgi:membrane-bound serine protease (ClpP class)
MKMKVLIIALLIPLLCYPKERIMVTEVNGVINPITERFLKNTLKKAEDEGVSILIIKIDTPGGLVTSTHEIVKSILNSEVCVVSYVFPKGARAASAGVFICLASDIIAMAPSTHIGAAHPVALHQKISKEAQEKIINDLVAEIKGIAKERGRNVEWAEKAVRESKSATEEEAVELKVADIIAKDLDELLKELDGWVIRRDDKRIVLHTKDVEVTEHKMSFRERFLHSLAEPNIAYIFLILGIYGLIYEFTSPGVGLGAVLGSIFLILAFFGLSNLSINLAGLLLIILGFVLLISEIKIQSSGLLGIGGICAITLGSFMLIDSTTAPAIAISKSLILSMVVTTGVLFFILITLGLHAQFRKVTTGREGVVGEVGIAKTNIKGSGMVFVDGEIWHAESEEEIKKGEKIEVIGMDGLYLKVKKRVD